MQLTGHITRDSLMTLEAYAKWRKAHKPEIIAHRKLRSVGLGDHVTLQFESEMTVRYQIQEMLRIEKIFEEEGIVQEIDLRYTLLEKENELIFIPNSNLVTNPIVKKT
jgi:small-conductance mechanosensitive channel